METKIRRVVVKDQKTFNLAKRYLRYHIKDRAVTDSLALEEIVRLYVADQILTEPLWTQQHVGLLGDKDAKAQVIYQMASQIAHMAIRLSDALSEED